MDEQDAQKRMYHLCEELLQYEYAYYVLQSPSINDIEYDQKLLELESLENQYPQYRRKDSPTQRVGSDLSSELSEVEHTLPVLSLDKVYSFDELVAWLARCEAKIKNPLRLYLEEKIDGLSIVLYYKNGFLEQALTRGNGYVGNDVTANVKTIKTVPLRLKEALTLAVRGEIYLAKDDFCAYNKEQEKPYANPRNLASGTLRRIKSSETAKVPLQIFCYEGFFEQGVTTHHEAMEKLQSLGFRVNPRNVYIESFNPHSRDDKKMLMQFVTKETQDRASLDYEIDGLVVKLDDLSAREALGYTGHHPRWAIAYKFESPQGLSKLISIDVQVGRTGRITPLARIEAVSIGGSIISNVTLHNQEYINQLELSIGDIVRVSKRGDVIPAVEEVVNKSDDAVPVYTMPETCPSCSSQLHIQGAHHFCVNSDCPDQLRNRLRFFVGRDQMDIEYLGPETTDFLFDNGFIQTIPDLFSFDYSKLSDYPGFGDKKIRLILQGIEKARKQRFETVLTSIGIPDLGSKMVQVLVRAGFDSLDKILELANNKQYEKLISIEGIGELKAKSIVSQLNLPQWRNILYALKDLGFKLEAEQARQAENLIFSGQTWCITGSFHAYKPRSKAGELVEQFGGKLVSSVSSKTTHLLAGDGAGTKLKKAQELNVKIVLEEEFTSMLEKA